jgi:hypothetical protein
VNGNPNRPNSQGDKEKEPNYCQQLNQRKTGTLLHFLSFQLLSILPVIYQVTVLLELLTVLLDAQAAVDSLSPWLAYHEIPCKLLVSCRSLDSLNNVEFHVDIPYNNFSGAVSSRTD